MQAQLVSEVALRKPEATPNVPNIHGRGYMRASISGSSRICAQELAIRIGDGYRVAMETTLAKNIEALRIAMGWNQTRLGKEVGAQQSQVSKWVKKCEVPSTGPMVALARLAGVSVEEFQNVPWATGRMPEAPIQVFLPVSLPSAERLTAMLRGLLTSVGLEARLVDAHAETLARRLPTALATIAAHPDDQAFDAATILAETPQPRAMLDRETQQ